MPAKLSMLRILLCAVSAAFAGCTTVVETENTLSPRVETLGAANSRQIMVTNYGYYLFNTIPLFSGGDEDGSFTLFSDKVNLDSAMKTFSKRCEDLNAKRVSDIQTEETSTCFFSWVKFLNTTWGIYWYRQVQVSGVAACGDSSGNSEENE